jgi:DNA-binding NarL/FixJ family response regulator
VRVLVADDDVHVRSALRLLLEQEVDVEVVGESDVADGLIAQVANSRAGVVLVDWELPGLRTNGLVSQLRSSAPKLRLVALSSRPEQRADAIRAGMDAFVCKGDVPETLLGTLRALHQIRTSDRQANKDPERQVGGQEPLEVVHQPVHEPRDQTGQQRAAP